MMAAVLSIDLPKLQTIQLGFSALSGHGDDECCTLTMKSMTRAMLNER